MIERPPVWESFKVKDVPNLKGTVIGDFVITGVVHDRGNYVVVMECPVCRAVRITNLYNANHAKGVCKHKIWGGIKYVD